MPPLTFVLTVYSIPSSLTLDKSVNSSGRVYAKSPGTAVVSAKEGNFSATCSVTVTKKGTTAFEDTDDDNIIQPSVPDAAAPEITDSYELEQAKETLEYVTYSHHL